MAAIVIVVVIITSNFRRKVSFYTVINFTDIKINWKTGGSFLLNFEADFYKKAYSKIVFLLQ
jgi:hypothetical protein